MREVDSSAPVRSASLKNSGVSLAADGPAEKKKHFTVHFTQYDCSQQHMAF